MGIKIKRMVVRAAATLAASANDFTAPIAVLGSCGFWFHIKATNAAQLASGCVTQASFDGGTTWQSTSTSTSTSGFLISATSGSSSAITLALNAGGIVVGPVIQNTLSTPAADAFPICRVPLARFKLTCGGSDITGLEVTAYVCYMDDGPTRLVTMTVDEGPFA